MAKGFSFVLVTVVMIMMLVFGMLSLSSASADKRLSEKAVSAQETYYGLDSRGEELLAACGNAAANAQAAAESFMSQKRYAQTLPEDFFACLQPLASSPGAAGSDSYRKLERGVMFYELEKQLSSVAGDFTISYQVDQSALKSALSADDGSSAVIATIYASIVSTESPNYSLNVSLACRFGTLDNMPSFETTQWQSNVSGLELSSSSSVHLFTGD